jgi:hypothetical protein
MRVLFPIDHSPVDRVLNHFLSEARLVGILRQEPLQVRRKIRNSLHVKGCVGVGLDDHNLLMMELGTGMRRESKVVR